MKPILFNTDMVREILEGRKTVTRRVAKITVNKCEPVSHVGCISVYYPSANKDGVCADFYDVYGFYRGAAKPSYQPGDIMYVRETWSHPSEAEIKAGADPNMYLYYADPLKPAAWGKWRPSIHMPKEAARIFLRVTDVLVERLQDITENGAIEEGCQGAFAGDGSAIGAGWIVTPVGEFSKLWDGTINPADRSTYGWAANPWVWVIEFERIGKEEAKK